MQIKTRYGMKKNSNDPWPAVRAKLFKMVSVGVIDEPINQAYDTISIVALLANLLVSVMATFDNLQAAYGSIFLLVEQVTVFLFGVDYVLRVITAPELYPEEMPYYLPVFFPSGVAAFRMFRVVRILRLFRINAYYDSLNVITEVLKSKKQQLLSSAFIIATLMLGSSLCMYSLEHEAQPEVFSNAFSGIWWAASTLLTVGYGDIYPITPLGKLFGICITFLGVGMVAIPTGIISAGFVEQYTQFALLGDKRRDETLRFISIELTPGDSWTNQAIRELKLPAGLLIAIVRRGKDSIVPNGDLVLEAGDIVVLGAEPLPGTDNMELREMTISSKHKWKDQAIRDLDISRQTFIIMVKRGDRKIVPRGSTVLQEGDSVYMYKKA